MSAKAFSELLSRLVMDESFRARFFVNREHELLQFDLSPEEERQLCGESLVVGFDKSEISIATAPTLEKFKKQLGCKHSYCCDANDLRDAHRSTEP